MLYNFEKLIGLLLLVVVAAITSPPLAKADNTTSLLKPPSNNTGAEKVDVDSIKEKYWARGDESEMGVVQNRLYSKAGRWEFGVFGGIIASNPFLSTQSVGFHLGYHFNEYISVHALLWKEYPGPSSALTAFEQNNQGAASTNPANAYEGGEIEASLIYGKLSLLGKSIVYYDMYLLGGVGNTSTSSGNDATVHVGIGQQVFLSNSFAIRVDYRLMLYNETILQQVVTPTLGQPIGNDLNLTHSITLGVDFFFGGGKK